MPTDLDAQRYQKYIRDGKYINIPVVDTYAVGALNSPGLEVVLLSCHPPGLQFGCSHPEVLICEDPYSIRHRLLVHL